MLKHLYRNNKLFERDSPTLSAKNFYCYFSVNRPYNGNDVAIRIG